jgi:hypothetical protein
MQGGCMVMAASGAAEHGNPRLIDLQAIHFGCCGEAAMTPFHERLPELDGE